MNTLKVLVTGASGFLGSEIVKQLYRNGIPIRAIGRQTKLSHKDIDYLQADILNQASVVKAMKGCQTVIHAAGLAHVFSANDNQADRFRTVNEQGTADVVKAASDLGIRHFVLISSVSVYGSSTHSAYEEKDPCIPEGPYAVSKYNAELKARELALTSNMAITILRLATLYGEGDPGNVNRLMRCIDKGRFIWLGQGNNRKSLLYKEDAARACMVAVSQPATGLNIYNVSAAPCTMREIVSGIASALGKRIPPLRIPASLALKVSAVLAKLSNPKLYRLHATVAKWLAEDIYDTRAFENRYNFRTEIQLTDGLERQVAWYRHSKITALESRIGNAL